MKVVESQTERAQERLFTFMILFSVFFDFLDSVELLKSLEILSPDKTEKLIRLLHPKPQHNIYAYPLSLPA